MNIATFIKTKIARIDTVEVFTYDMLAITQSALTDSDSVNILKGIRDYQQSETIKSIEF
jgi:hypothetical protein